MVLAVGQQVPIFVVMKKSLLLSFLTMVLLWLGLSAFLVNNYSVKKDFMQAQFSTWESYLPHADRLNPEVSQAEVAWHLDHMLKVINNICEILSNSNPSAYKWNPNILKSAVFLSGSMPRGRGKAPKSVTPPPEILTEALLQQLEIAKANVAKLDSLPEKANFKHPVFGMLNRDQTARFLEIHTDHHLKIIRDIVAE